MANKIEEEEPLDPVMEKVRVKMVRLLMVSIGVMLIALMSVLFAVVYKVTKSDDKTEAEPINNGAQTQEITNVPLKENIEVDLPDGASITSSNLVGNRLVLNVRLNDGQKQFWIVDLSTGTVSRVTTK